MNAVIELEEAYNYYKNDPEFNRELTELFERVRRSPLSAVLCGEDDHVTWAARRST